MSYLRRCTTHALAALLITCSGIIGCDENPSSSSSNPLPPIHFRCYSIASQTGFDAMAVWDAPADSAAVTGYTIWWRDQSSNTTDSASVDATARWYRIVEPTGVNYVVSIAARHASSVSEKVSVQWARPSFLAMPDSLSVEFIGNTGARLRWHGSSDPNVTAHYVHWTANVPGLEGGRLIAAPAASTDIFDLDCSARYTFSVRSVRGSDTSAPVTVDTANTYVTPPTDLRASALGDNRISLKWLRSPDTSVTAYVVTWRATGTSLSGTDTLTDLTAAIGVAAPHTYSVTVAALRCTHISAPLTMECASAIRRGYDSTEPIRLYEPTSANGCGLVIDPAMGGPLTVSVGASNPAPGNVQLALFTNPSEPGTFQIGPAFAFKAFPNADQFDRNTYISDSAYPMKRLDSWYLSGPFDNQFTGTGNVSVFTFATTSALGHAFFIRTGPEGNRH